MGISPRWRKTWSPLGLAPALPQPAPAGSRTIGWSSPPRSWRCRPWFESYAPASFEPPLIVIVIGSHFAAARAAAKAQQNALLRRLGRRRHGLRQRHRRFHPLGRRLRLGEQAEGGDV